MANVGDTLELKAAGTYSGTVSSLTYKWQRSNNGATGWSDIPGATGLAYTAALEDGGKFVAILEVAIGPGGSTDTRSAAEAVNGISESTWFVPLTIPTGKVTADLTSFPVMVNLADMPAAFWTHVKRDGGDIRVQTPDGAAVPFDLVSIDVGLKRGLLFFKASSLQAASNNAWWITYGPSALQPLDPAHPNGRNSVWSDYHRVVVFADLVDRTGSGNDPVIAGDAEVGGFKEVAVSPGTNSKQGVAWDGTYFYTFDTNAIRKWNASWSLIASNTNPIGQSGLAGVDHVGDGEVHNGRIYVPIELFPNDPYNNQHIAVFDSATLAFVTSYDISAQGHEASSIAYNPADGLMYVTAFAGAGSSTTVYKYNPADFSFAGTVTLSKAVASMQGITFFNGAMYVSSGAGGEVGVVKFRLDGTFEQVAYRSNSGSFIEGLSHTADALLWMVSNRVHVLQPSEGIPDWLNVGGTGHAVLTPVTKFTEWSLGVSAAMSQKGTNKSAISYTQANATASTYRETLVYRGSTTDRWGLWNANDSWLTGGTSPATGQVYRLNATHQGTVRRDLFINGAQLTDLTVVQKPGGTGDGLFIGSAGVEMSEAFVGSLNYAYLRSGILSPQWIAAEAANWNNPGSFYMVGSETPL